MKPIKFHRADWAAILLGAAGANGYAGVDSLTGGAWVRGLIFSVVAVAFCAFATHLTRGMIVPPGGEIRRTLPRLPKGCVCTLELRLAPSGLTVETVAPDGGCTADHSRMAMKGMD